VHRIFRPIRELVAATNRIAAGGWDTQVEVERNDVIGTLARSFNEMVNHIRRQQDDLYAAKLQVDLDLEKALDDLLSQMLAALIESGLVKVSRISQDGTRVRAGAGRKSFKRKPTLQELLLKARAHVSAMKRQAEDAKMPLKRQKAMERAAQQRERRIEKALEEVAKVAFSGGVMPQKSTDFYPKLLSGLTIYKLEQ